MAEERENSNEPKVHPRPILEAKPEFWWLSETDRANAIEARARNHNGQGYRYHGPSALSKDQEQDRGR
jgi:hypothetical protein